MWVSRKEWYELTKKVSDLKYELGVYRESLERRTHIHVCEDHIKTYDYGPRHTKIYHGDAIEALADKIGFKFKYQEGTPTTAVLVKKAK